MQKLVTGYRRFHSRVFPQKRKLYQKLAEGQHPRYLFITCADSRVDPLDFTSMEPGEMFMERSLGNIIPVPTKRTPEPESASTIEYAVKALGVKHVIVCGHSQCGAMKALLDPFSLSELPLVSTWLNGAADTLASVAKKYGHLQGEALLEATIRENVLIQMDHVRRQPSVAAKLAEDQIQVHGWVFDVEHGSVAAYHPESGEFMPLTEAYRQHHRPRA